MENAKLVSILREGELLVLAPYKNGGTKGKSKGYTQLSDKQITLNTKDMEEVAKTCLQLFDECELKCRQDDLYYYVYTSYFQYILNCMFVMCFVIVS